MTEVSNKYIDINDINIRQLYDEVGKKWYFSVVDIINIISDTTDARNYWKTLKNRLKKGQNKLVTECNQLKMKANDGKYYLTDSADKNTILGIIEVINPSYLDIFEEYFNKVSKGSPSSEREISTVSKDMEENFENELPLDVYQEDNYLLIKAFIGGVNLDNLKVEIGYEKVIIKGKRFSEINVDSTYQQELIWGNFSRVFSFPVMVDITEAEATLAHGLLNIKVKKLDREKIKEIRIKSI